MKAFTKRLANRFQLSDTASRLGYITYSDDASVAFALNTLKGTKYNYDGIAGLIDKIAHKRGSARMVGQALNMAYLVLLAEQNGARKDSRKVRG